MADSRPVAGRRARRGFTLIELLICISVLVLLIAIILPVANRLRDASRRATDLSNLRQLTQACIAYAQENDGSLPPGRVSFAAPGADDLTWLSYNNCWSKLAALVPSLANINSCYSVRDGFEDADDFGLAANDYGAPQDTRVGWIYWGGRDDLYLAGRLQYRSPRRLGQHLTPGSSTLWTCWCWDSDSHGARSICPHVGSRFVTYPNGTALKPPPDGLGIALDDGSASFVPWHDMGIIAQANGFKLYYQP